MAASLARTTLTTAAAFGTYFAMYGFRKPFTAATYADTPGWFGLDAKTLLVTAQVLGYTVSKFVGIGVVARMPAGRRALALLALIAVAEAALVGFGVAPDWLRPLLLFVNGLPLGMVFGLVLGFLEGRRHTEAMTAGLCASFIVADGAAKSLGSSLLAAGVPEAWMPAVAGALAALPLVPSVWLLAGTPPPDPDDVRSRSERTPMARSDRLAFFRRHATGLVLLVAGYLLVTVLRSLRSDFAPELLQQLGATVQASTFTSMEVVIAVGVLVAAGATVLVRDNRRAFAIAIGIASAGFAGCLVALALQRTGQLGGVPFFVVLGLGLYLPYVAVHTTVFERLVAMTRDRGNIGYLMYLADSFGYLGYVAVALGRGSLPRGEGLLPFFVTTAWLVACGGLVCFVAAGVWFLRQPPRPRTSTLAAAAGQFQEPG